MGRIGKTYKLITCINILEDNRICGGVIVKEMEYHSDTFYCSECKALYFIPVVGMDDAGTIEPTRCKMLIHRTNNPDDTSKVRCFGTITRSSSGHNYICSRCNALYDL
jgi:hypothetical protein